MTDDVREALVPILRENRWRKQIGSDGGPIIAETSDGELADALTPVVERLITEARKDERACWKLGKRATAICDRILQVLNALTDRRMK